MQISISIVKPCYKSQAIFNELCLRFIQFYKKLVEILLINDSNADQGWNCIKRLVDLDISEASGIKAPIILRHEKEYFREYCP